MNYTKCEGIFFLYTSNKHLQNLLRVNLVLSMLAKIPQAKGFGIHSMNTKQVKQNQIGRKVIRTRRDYEKILPGWIVFKNMM